MLLKLGFIALSVLVGDSLATPVATSTTSTSATPSPSACKPPTLATRPACGSNPSMAFSLQLAKCGNTWDNQYLNAARNTTSSATTANVYAQKTGPKNDYLYPGASTTYGPWAWNALFAGAVSSGVNGLQLVSFANGGNSLTCKVTGDVVPFDCGVANWVVNNKTGELFVSSSSQAVKGYAKVVPYIVQQCSA